ncbi:MAG: alanine racemase, partial [Tenericutes bacterium HGW-Tenericutes-6]
MYPSIHIDLNKFRHNLDYLSQAIKKQGVTSMVVSKVFCADQKLIDVINTLDIEYIADSRIMNLKDMKTNKTKVLLRIPHLSEVSDVIRYADVSLNSEIKVIKALNEAALKEHVKHQIILMFDIGDLREGIYYQTDYIKDVKEILELKNIELLGIGTNLTCYGGVVPTIETYEKLEQIKKQIESMFSIHLKIISGGNSSSIKLALDHKLPSFINHFRIGEAFVLGRETAYGKHLENMFDDVFTLKAEIIELKQKPSLP